MKQQLENPKTAPLLGQINPKSLYTAMSSRELAENILLFVISRIVYLDYLISPFGCALFAALFMRKKRISYVIFSLLGAASTGLPLFFFKYAGAALVICTIQLIFKKELEHKKRLTALLSASSLFVNGGIYVLFEGLFSFDALLLILECAITTGAFFVFDKGIVLTRRKSGKLSLDLHELMCVAFLLGTAILSLALTENFEPIAHVASIFIILFAALTYGAVPCAPIGAVFGLALGAATTFPTQLICIYTLSSLSCGLVHRYGRMAVSGAFASCALLSTLILCPEANGILTVSYVAAACLLLFFVPDKALTRLASYARQPRKDASFSAKVKDAVSEKFTEIIDSTQSVSTIFYEVIDSLRDPFYETTTAVFEATADTVCSDCSLCRYCWHKDREKTKDTVERMCTAMESKNVFSNKDIPKEFADICIRSEAFVSELAKNLESFKVAKMWSGKLLESKRLVAEQFRNISMILSDTQKSISQKITFLPDAERHIASEFEKLGISADKISVYANDGYYVEIQKPSCDNKTECDLLIPSVLSDILEVPMVRMPVECTNSGCTVSFCEKPALTTDIATSSATKKNSTGSGDSLCCFSPEAGKVAIVLCDGMGSGEHANYQSNIATELCKKLLTAGFQKETCVRLINDILLTGADRDSFSTMDICVINLYNARAEFTKAGAPDSYIIHSNSSSVVEGASLPAGMLSEIEPDIHEKTICAGDYIIMATDGITDAFDASDADGIYKLCENFEGTAKELSDKILNRALTLSQNCPTDDMTVTVCKFCA